MVTNLVEQVGRGHIELASWSRNETVEHVIERWCSDDVSEFVEQIVGERLVARRRTRLELGHEVFGHVPNLHHWHAQSITDMYFTCVNW